MIIKRVIARVFLGNTVCVDIIKRKQKRKLDFEKQIISVFLNTASFITFSLIFNIKANIYLLITQWINNYIFTKLRFN